MIHFMQEDKLVYRVWPFWIDTEAMDYKIVTVEQFVQITMVCKLLDIDMVEMHYVDPSLV